MADTIDKTSYKVCLVGASGGIGQVLALLLKINPKISELSLYDVVNTMGVAADLSHVSTTTKITGYVGSEQLDAALIGSDVVVVVAGIPRKPGMSRDDLFDINSKIVYGIAESCARICPTAMFLIVSNPVNSNVPIFAEVLRSYREPPCSVHALIHHKPHVLGVYNARKLLGVTTLDTVRTNTFVSELVNLDVRNVNVRVIGGHTNTTILPLLSQISSLSLSEEEICKLTSRIRNAGDEVVAAKDGAGSATLSMAYAANHLICRLLDAFSGAANIVECAFVECSVTESPFFSAPVRLTSNGIEEVLSYGPLSTYEQSLLDELIPDLVAQIKKGIGFVENLKHSHTHK